MHEDEHDQIMIDIRAIKSTKSAAGVLIMDHIWTRDHEFYIEEL